MLNCWGHQVSPSSATPGVFKTLNEVAVVARPGAGRLDEGLKLSSIGGETAKVQMKLALACLRFSLTN